jgi:hypothetical protein
MKTTAHGVVRLHPYERFLPAAVKLTIRVTKPGLVGKHTVLKIRSGLAPVRVDRCMAPGSSAPVSCSAV